MYHKNNKKLWDKEIVKLLIIKYQEHENLYDAKNPMYEDRDKRSNSLYEICKKLKQLNDCITVEDIKKKIHTLRTQYIKESREIGRGERSVPKLWCFHQLEFLKNHCTIKKADLTSPNVDKCDNSNMEESLFIDIKSEPLDYPKSNVEERFVNAESSGQSIYSVTNVHDVNYVDIVKTEPTEYSQSNIEEELPVRGCSSRTVENNESEAPSIHYTSSYEKEIPTGINNERPASSRYNKRKKAPNLEDRLENVKRLLMKRLEEKSDYDWLAKQVVFEMKLIKNKKIQRDTAWKIQTILREASIEDATTSKYQADYKKREFQLEKASNFTGCFLKDQPKSSHSSSSARPHCDVMDKSASCSRTPVHPVRPLQITSVKSYNTNTYIPSSSISQ